jgi:hypothetical protein
MDDELERIWKEVAMASKLRYDPVSFLEVQRKTMKNLT